MTIPNFHFEKILWDNGFTNVAGMDEVGRGSLAGPVVASAVFFAPSIIYKKIDIKIDDSKRLNPSQRNNADEWIRKNSEGWGIGVSTVAEINKLGIVRATEIAYRRALFSANKSVSKWIEHLLIDAFYIPYLRNYRQPKRHIKKLISCGNYIKGKHRQMAITKGDQLSLSIASASIIAKVYRDNLMKNLGKNFGVYDWSKNKGYGTKTHRDAILKFGITKHHRNLFVRNVLAQTEYKV